MVQMVQDPSGRMVTVEERRRQLGIYDTPQDVDRDIKDLENQLKAKKEIKKNLEDAEKAKEEAEKKKIKDANQSKK